MEITYEPIDDGFNPSKITKDDLYQLNLKLQSLFEDGEVPKNIIQIEE